MKISIIMPTYNDSDTIMETIESVINQSYKDWQLIIVDDGSTENIQELIKKYIEDDEYNQNIEYYYQDNQDQLNAIKNSIKYIKGDYIYILHSDDLLPRNTFLEDLSNTAKENEDIDVFIGDLIQINEYGASQGLLKTSKYTNNEKNAVMLMLWLGRNLYVDVIFAKKDIFISKINDSYLTWNMPFWINFENGISMLNVKNVKYPMLKYRVHSNNYINDELGKLNVINGELRSATRLMEYYNIPLYKLQYILYRIFNKVNISNLFIPIYVKKEQKNKWKIVEFIIKKRFGKGYIDNLYLHNLVRFYKNYRIRDIFVGDISQHEIIYKGKDMRLFNKDLLSNQLPEIYNSLIKEMGIGFNQITVTNEYSRIKMIEICKFLCIYPYVKINIVKNK